MNSRIAFVALAVVGLAGFAGCDLILGTVPEGRLEATVADESRIGTDTSVAGEYVGTGHYDMHLTPTDLDAIKIYSDGTGDSEGDRVILAIYQRGWPGEGEYDLNMNPWYAAQGNRVGASGQYWIIRPDSVLEIYWADAGQFVISEVHRRYMEGSFTMTGRLCLVKTPLPNRTSAGPCNEPVPIVIPDSARTTEVSGTFVVTKQEEP
ncbi:MAG: hypothetical protein R6U63_12325 [Longimicrobiales bacterium]